MGGSLGEALDDRAGGVNGVLNTLTIHHRQGFDGFIVRGGLLMPALCGSSVMAQNQGCSDIGMIEQLSQHGLLQGRIFGL